MGTPSSSILLIAGPVPASTFLRSLAFTAVFEKPYMYLNMSSSDTHSPSASWMRVSQALGPPHWAKLDAAALGPFSSRHTL